MTGGDPYSRLETIAREHSLDAGAVEQIRLLLGALEAEVDPHTTVSTLAEALDVHVADGLSGLAVADLASARQFADLGILSCPSLETETRRGKVLILKGLKMENPSSFAPGCSPPRRGLPATW